MARLGLLYAAVFLFLNACDMPADKLTKDQRLDELEWVIDKFEHNYAPLKYKEATLVDDKGQKKFNWENKKAEYRAKMEQDLSNEQLIQTLEQFVSEVEDAHTSLSYLYSMVPGKVQVAYLGFVGVRVTGDEKDLLKVKEFVPTVEQDSDKYPLKTGDKIVSIDGQDVYTFAKAHCPKSLGQPESNKTAFMPMAALMISLSCRLPESKEAKLVLIREDEELQVTLPWVVMDYHGFLQKQQKAKKELEGEEDEESEEKEDDGCKEDEKEAEIKKTLSWSRRPLVWNLQQYFRYLSDAALKDLMLKDNFSVHYINADMLLQPIFSDDEDDSCEDDEKDLGILLPNDEFEVRAIKRDKGVVGYIRVPDFTPGSSDDAVEAFEEALAALKDLNIQKIVLDLVNNGGGSLAYGLRIGALLKGENATEPSIEVKLNDNWLNTYQTESLFGSNDATREIARRRYETLKADLAQGKQLSDKFSFRELDLETKPNKPTAATPVVLMVNENCASMCDIFTADLKDNGIAKIIGRKTMGAGGNVVMHGVSPRLNLLLAQTESLVVRANGEYIENKGVEPDKVYKTDNFDWKDGYDSFIKDACDYALE